MIFSGCQGKALPEGMEEDVVLSSGEDIVDLLIAEDFDQVYERLREDIQAGTSVDDIEELMDKASDGLGEFDEVTDTLVTGVRNADVPHAIAVIRCKYEKKSIVFRVAFDTEMELIGLEIKRS